jgi:hypothetical protein
MSVTLNIYFIIIHSFSCSSHLEHRAPFGVSVITAGLLWTSDDIYLLIIKFL